MHDYVHYYNHERIKLRLLGRSPAEYQIKKHRLNGGIVTVQLLGGQFIPGAIHYSQQQLDSLPMRLTTARARAWEVRSPLAVYRQLLISHAATTQPHSLTLWVLHFRFESALLIIAHARELSAYQTRKRLCVASRMIT